MSTEWEKLQSGTIDCLRPILAFMVVGLHAQLFYVGAHWSIDGGLFDIIIICLCLLFIINTVLVKLNVYENVLVGASLGKGKADVEQIIETVGLKKHRKKYMHELSGGEQQRVSIARALAKNPEVMFCDEPTGALDEKTGKVVLESLVDANEKMGTTMIIVTHNPGIALIGDRIIKMNSGKIVEEIINKKRTNPKDIPWG